MCSVLISVLYSRLPAIESWQDPLTRLGLSVTPQDERPEAPTALQDQPWRCLRKGTSLINCAQVLNVHELWLNIVSIPLVCDLDYA